jgi:photosystem II stability/assembly factor-like uncharacterized protein
MNTFTRWIRAGASLALCVAAALPLLAADSPEETVLNDEVRAALPCGGNFDPKPEEGIFVAAGHGLNVVASRDDGKTWTQVFMGRPGGDHGYWAVWNTVAYTEGVIAIAAGWGGPGTIIASDDGANWRHLADAGRTTSRKDGKPYDMPNTMELLGVKGSFILPLEATPDFGKTWHRASAYAFTNAAGERLKVDVGHPSAAYADWNGGRVIVVGDSGPSIYSDDLGKTWKPFEGVKAEPWGEGGAKGIIGKGDVFLLLKGDGSIVLRSVDGGLTWQAHPLGVKRPQGRMFSLSVIGDRFVIAGDTAKSSVDGIVWEDLPKETPSGRIAVSDTGAMINVNRSRNSILRSADGKTWETVYTFEPTGTGGAQGLADVVYGKVKKIAAPPAVE